MKSFITGGAGFIGSHIVDLLIDNKNEVLVYDNFSTGQLDFLKKNINNNNLTIVKADILDMDKLVNHMKSVDIVYHFAANADVRGGIDNTDIDFQQNTIGTKNVLEGMRINKIKKLVFSSSAVVYGEPNIFPTPENIPLIQTSLYGASKLAGEAMIEAYCEYFDMQAWIFRFVSWIGERYSHGVIFDFINKLIINPHELEILGNGEQKKSYLYVKDGINGIFFALKNFNDKINIFNLGHKEIMNVTDVADIVIEEMKLSNVKKKFTGSDRGWIGDSPFVHLDISKLNTVGWLPQKSIEDGIRITAQYLLNNIELLKKRI